MLAALARDLPATIPESRNERITGDKATLEVRDIKRDRWEAMTFIREQGQWKLVLAALDDFRNWLIREAAYIATFRHYFALCIDPKTSKPSVSSASPPPLVDVLHKPKHAASLDG
jgi:hypothetical protein